MRIETTEERAGSPRAKALGAALSIVIAGVAGLTGSYYLNPTVDIGLEVLTQHEYDQLISEYRMERTRVSVDKPGLCLKFRARDVTLLSHEDYQKWVETLNVYLRANVLENRRPIIFSGVTEVNMATQLNTWLEVQ